MNTKKEKEEGEEGGKVKMGFSYSCCHGYLFESETLPILEGIGLSSSDRVGRPYKKNY